MGEYVFLLILAAMGVVMLFETAKYPNVGFADRVTGPARFPQMIIAFLLACIVLLVIMKIVKKEKTNFAFLELFSGIRLFLNVMVVLYVLTLQSLGFILSTSVFLIATVTWFRYRDTGKFAVLGAVARSAVIVAAVVGVYLVFTKVLIVTLPRGVIPI